MPNTRERTKSVSNSKEKVIEIISDPAQLLTFIQNPENEVSQLADSGLGEGVMMLKLFQAVVFSNQKLADSNAVILTKLEQTEVKLQLTEARLKDCEEKLAESEGNFESIRDYSKTNDDEVIFLKRRVAQLEQYSRRSTLILTGIPHEENENIETKVCDLVNKSKVLKLDGSHIAHVHRNRVKPGSDRPPSTTLVLHKSSLVDRLLYKKKDYRAANSGMNIFPAMSFETQNIKDEFEACKEVQWCDFRGHSKWFTVKMRNGKFCNGVMDTFDLVSKSGGPLSFDQGKFNKMRDTRKKSYMK